MNRDAPGVRVQSWTVSGLPLRRAEGTTVINGIESAIDRVVNQLPVGQDTQQDIRKAFVELLDRVVTESVSGAAAPPSNGTPVTATQLMPELKAAGTPAGASLLIDTSLPALEQLSNDLTAADPIYNEREGMLRSRLDVSELERRLRTFAESMGVEYSSTDLDGILRNAGYGAAHLGSSDRYMAAIDTFTNEAYTRYRERAGNLPGTLA